MVEVIFGMAATSFHWNGILLIKGNLPRVIQVVFQMYRNIMLVFLSLISIFNFCLWGMVKLSVLNIFFTRLETMDVVYFDQRFCLVKGPL